MPSSFKGGFLRDDITGALVVSGAGSAGQVPGNRIFVIGDSIPANGVAAGGGWEGRAWYIYGSMMADAKFDIRGVAASGGFTLEQIRTTHLPTALASDANFVLVQGGRNDVLAPTPIAAIRTTLDAICDAIVSAGKVPILTTQTAQGTSGSPNTAAQKTLKEQIDTYIRLKARINKWPLTDAAAATTDPANGAWKAGISADVSHPNNVGSRVIGQKLADDLSPFLQPQAQYRPLDGSIALSGINLVSGPLMLVDAGADGITDSAVGQWTVPASWTATGTFSLVAAASGDTIGQWQKIARTGGAGNKGVQIPPSGGQVTTAVAGDRMAFTFKIKTNAVESGVGTFHARCFSGALIYAGLNGYTADIPTAGRYYSEFIVQSGFEAIGAHFVITAGVCDISIAEVAVVNLTQSGLA
jgi:lysophospholipase L1-like esterase